MGEAKESEVMAETLEDSGLVDPTHPDFQTGGVPPLRIVESVWIKTYNPRPYAEKSGNPLPVRE